MPPGWNEELPASFDSDPPSGRGMSVCGVRQTHPGEKVHSTPRQVELFIGYPM